MQIEFTDSNGFAFLENLGFRFHSDATPSCRASRQPATPPNSLAPNLVSRRRPSVGGGSSAGNGASSMGNVDGQDEAEEGFAMAENVTTMQVGTYSSFQVGDVEFNFQFIGRDPPEKFLVQDDVAVIECQRGCVSFAVESVQRFNFSYGSVGNTGGRGLGSVSFRTPPSSTRGYSEVLLKNGNGAERRFPVIYYTEGCPLNGWWGEGADCRPCPVGASCPGGYRYRPALLDSRVYTSSDGSISFVLLSCRLFVGAEFGLCPDTGPSLKMPLGSAFAARCRFAKEGRRPTVRLGNPVCKTKTVIAPETLICTHTDEWQHMQVPFALHANRGTASARADCVCRVRTGPFSGRGTWHCISSSRCSLLGCSSSISKSALLRLISWICVESFMH
jgi:hypothetical protein